MLTHTEARNIAESLWGTGGTHSYKCNRRGAFYFSCAGHGGYIVDAAALSDSERAQVTRYVCTEKYDRYSWGKRSRFMHPYRRRGARVPFDCARVTGAFLIFEEDCDWSVLERFTDIRAAGMALSDAERAAAILATFDRWHGAKERAP